MKKHVIALWGLAGLLLTTGCNEFGAGKKHIPTPPQFEARIDRSTPPARMDIEQALQQAKSLKLSQIASEIEYYRVGDATFTVTQAIAIPDSNAFITFNNPRIYYRKKGIPSKRYAFKALAYKWNNEMNGCPMFYDKKTTRMYVALSGKNQTNRGSDKGDKVVESEDAKHPVVPCIGQLPQLDTLLTMFNYIYPENTPVKYPLDLTYDKLLGFSSSGYTLCNYGRRTGEPSGITTFNLQGDTLCKIRLKENRRMVSRTVTENVPFFQTAYWNEAQDRMTFMIPYCDTVYQLTDPQTVVPLYEIHLGQSGISLPDLESEVIPKGKIWLRTLFENPKGLFAGFNQKGSPAIKNWLDQIDNFKPIISGRSVYLKADGQTYMLPQDSKGFVNDLDGGLSFWPDGQTDNCLYMIRTVTEMRETIKRTGSPQQQELIQFLDDPTTHERDYVMIVVR